MGKLSKVICKQAQELVGIAHKRELNHHIGELAKKIDEWRDSKIECWDLTDVIHQFHDGVFRDVYKIYNNNKELIFLISRAIVHGYLLREEVSKEITELAEPDIKLIKSYRITRIYKFKISIKESVPEIWRKIQVPEHFSFGDMHYAIQSVMDWTDSHLHEFEIKDPNTKKPIRIGLPDPDCEDDTLLSSWETSIKDYFTPKNKRALYRYDFGDDWELNIILEDILEKDIQDNGYPKCIAGERAAPPEDSGGIYRYNYIIDILKNRKSASKEDKESLEDFLGWIGEDFEPEKFSFDDVEFYDLA